MGFKILRAAFALMVILSCGVTFAHDQNTPTPSTIATTNTTTAIGATRTTSPFKVASVEFNPTFLEFEKNFKGISDVIENAASNGAKLIVLPEMATIGYIYQNLEQIKPFLDTIPGKTTAMIANITRKDNIYVVVGIGEIDPNSGLAYNSAALIGPQGYIGKYRKNGLNSDDEKWASRGNLGFPVFNTTLGKIALLICYDDSYLQSVLIPAVRGADIIAYLTASDRLPLDESGSAYNHSTIANIASLPGWVGTYVIGTSRTGTEFNPADNRSTYYVGGASIWDPNGKNLAQAKASTLKNPIEAQTIYAEVDPAMFKNAAKQVLLSRRRPELYTVMNLYRAPLDPKASTTSNKVQASILQYTPVVGDVDANLKKIKAMLQKKKSSKNSIILLPENSLIGKLDANKASANAIDTDSKTFMDLAALAKQNNSFLAFSSPEKDNGKLYATAFLIDNQGKLVGKYRKTHLNMDEKKWATAGSEINVIETAIGRIGFILGDEVLVPDISLVLAMRRADIILIPSAWSGEYGTDLFVDPGLLIKPYPKNGMTIWYSVGKFAQAYTLVANYVGGNSQYKGSSAMYSLDPVQDHYVPVIASNDKEEVLEVNFETLGKSDWWINQNYMIIGQRVELNAPLTLQYDSAFFKEWQNDSTGNSFCWNK